MASSPLTMFTSGKGITLTVWQRRSGRVLLCRATTAQLMSQIRGVRGQSPGPVVVASGSDPGLRLCKRDLRAGMVFDALTPQRSQATPRRQDCWQPGRVRVVVFAAGAPGVQALPSLLFTQELQKVFFAAHFFKVLSTSRSSVG